MRDEMLHDQRPLHRQYRRTLAAAPGLPGSLLLYEKKVDVAVARQNGGVRITRYCRRMPGASFVRLA